MNKNQKLKRIKPRKRKIDIENLPISKDLEIKLDYLAKALVKQIDKEVFERKTAPAKEVLKLIGAGVFIASTFAFPTLPLALKPFFDNPEKYEVWKRFNIPYLKRAIKRLESQKLVNLKEENNYQSVEITDRGRRRILRFALDELTIKKPKLWDSRWRLVSYDIPGNLRPLRDIFREYLRAWGFYPLHESVFLHAYPCEREVEFLREYLGIGQYVRIFIVSKIENDDPFRSFFGV